MNEWADMPQRKLWRRNISAKFHLGSVEWYCLGDKLNHGVKYILTKYWLFFLRKCDHVM